MLLLTRPHETCDIILVCRGDPKGPAHKDVEFFCHKSVLESNGGMFQGMRKFEQASGSRASSSDAPLRVEVPASEVVVFEVLRYLYCGAVFFPLGFRTRLAEFLNVIDYMGLVCDAPPDEEGAQGIFADPSVQRLLREMSHAQLGELLQGGATPSFSMRRALLSAVARLRRPEEAAESMEASDDCHPGSEALPARQVPYPDAAPMEGDWLWPGDAWASPETPSAPASAVGEEQRRFMDVDPDSMAFAHLRSGSGGNVVAVC